MKKNKSKGNVSVSTVVIIVLLTVVIVGFAMEKLNQKSGGNNSTTTNGANAPADPSRTLVGKSAPIFSLADRDGNVYNNENLKGKRVVLFFNEGLMCYPACWNQMMEFPKDKRFDQDDIAVFSVVVDTKESWQKAIEKMPEMALVKSLHDIDRSASKNFQMLGVPSSMHAGSMPGHTYVVIDREGIVRYVLDDPKMAIHNGTIYSEIEKLK